MDGEAEMPCPVTLTEYKATRSSRWEYKYADKDEEEDEDKDKDKSKYAVKDDEKDNV